MKYAENGSLRKNLQSIFNYKWIAKLIRLHQIINGLEMIHQQKLVHCDLHHGNILEQQKILSISDLGLCKPVKYFQSHSKKNEIYGVLPFVVPEILRGKPYTTASDIYSFSMIMWELTSGIFPFDDREHGFHLALNICNGERPEIIENTPQCYIDLMKKCWDEDPLKRPNARKIKNIIENWCENIGSRKNISENINYNIKEFYEADKFLKQEQINVSTSKSHPHAYHTSRLLDFTKHLDEVLNQKEKEKTTYLECLDQGFETIR